MNIEGICGYVGCSGKTGHKTGHYSCCKDQESGYVSDDKPGPTRRYLSGPRPYSGGGTALYSDQDGKPTL